MIALFGAGLLLFFNEQLWRLFDSTAKGLDPRLAFVPWALLLVWALMKANYAEISRRDAEIKDLTQRLIDEQQEHLFEPFRYRMIKVITTDFEYEYKELIRKLESGEGTHAELSAGFDSWDARVAQHIKLIDESEVVYLRQPMEAAALPDDWRERLRAIIEVRKTRMKSIQIRQKLFLDARVAVRKKQRADRVKAAKP